MLMADNVKIPRRPLHDELAGLIRAMIVEGKLTPGQRISEQKLCTRFGVSRTPLREALKVLSVERLVRLLPNRGAGRRPTISSQSSDFSKHSPGNRHALASVTARPPKCGQMVEHFRRDEKLHYVQLHRAIHEAIIKAAGNETLSEVHHTSYARLSSVLSVAREPHRASLERMPSTTTTA
jgi:DNA-binding GntR family transcriptional regulator